VKLIDANLLLYAVNSSSPQHQRAKGWLEATLSSSETVAFTWPVLLAFLRLSTRALVVQKPLSTEKAFAVIEGWLSPHCATVVHPTGRHAKVLKDLLLPLGTAGNLTTDAHLAALAIENGAQLCSSDGDFARFPGLDWFNPLE
jgi:hypothetical protein